MKKKTIKDLLADTTHAGAKIQRIVCADREVLVMRRMDGIVFFMFGGKEHTVDEKIFDKSVA